MCSDSYLCLYILLFFCCKISTIKCIFGNSMHVKYDVIVLDTATNFSISTVIYHTKKCKITDKLF